MKARALYNNAILGGNDGGFSLVELLIALTILAIGLLAIAHMQILSIQGSAAARRFGTATNLAQREIEDIKGPGPMYYVGNTYINKDNPEIINITQENDADANFSPSLDVNTDIDSIIYDSMKVYDWFDTTEAKCGPLPYPGKCNYGPMDFVIYINVRNTPNSLDAVAESMINANVVMKEIKIFVLWEEIGTHHVAVRTNLARRDSDFW